MVTVRLIGTFVTDPLDVPVERDYVAEQLPVATGVPGPGRGTGWLNL